MYHEISQNEKKKHSTLHRHQSFKMPTASVALDPNPPDTWCGMLHSQNDQIAAGLPPGP